MLVSTFLDAAGVWPTRADRYMGHADHSTPGRYRHQLEGQFARTPHGSTTTWLERIVARRRLRRRR